MELAGSLQFSLSAAELCGPSPQLTAILKIRFNITGQLLVIREKISILHQLQPGQQDQRSVRRGSTPLYIAVCVSPDREYP
jgi:hypothetical protein